MPVKLRLVRMGKKKQPIYKIVATNSRSPRDSKYIEVIGRYSPLSNPASVTTNEDRLFHWLKVGAQPTTTVRSLLRKNGQWMKWSLVKQKKDEALINSLMEKWTMTQDLKLKKAEERKSRRKSAKKKTTEAPAASETKTEEAALQ
ncbi:MAG: 30S ribosomal protein S16 [Bacteroidetes bacterium]|nr:30S ribosomal protein S16 [Bacteroidota bacterium]